MRVDGRLAAVAVHALRILAARHLEAVRRARELHVRHARRRHVLQRDRAPAEQIGRAGQDLERRHAAGERARELRVVGPDRCSAQTPAVSDRSPRCRRREPPPPGDGVDAEMRVSVDHSGRHPPAASVDHTRVGRYGGSVADRLDAPVRHDDDTVVDLLASGSEHRRVDDRRRLRGQRPIGARIRIVFVARVERTRERHCDLAIAAFFPPDAAGVAEHATTAPAASNTAARYRNRLLMTDRP